jgi:thiol-disulfide isomerase/thioredoxin
MDNGKGWEEIVKIVLWMLAAFLTVLSGFQLYVLFRGWRSRGRPVNDLPGEPGKAVASGRKVAIYLWSPNCPGCRVQTRIIDTLGAELPDVYRINVIEDRATARALGVLGTPSTVVFENGVVKEFFVGVKTEESLRQALR